MEFSPEDRASECPLCGGDELPTGQQVEFASGLVHAQRRCQSCGSESSVHFPKATPPRDSTDPRVVYQRPSILMIMASGFVGGTAGLLGGVNLLLGGFSALTVGLLVAGVAVVAVGMRPRVVWFEPATRLVRVEWGRRWPLPLERVTPDRWQGFDIEKTDPVTVLPAGSGGLRTREMPRYWRLRGTVDGRHVVIADCASVAEAEDLRATLARRS